MDSAVNAGRALAQQLTIVNRKGLHARASARFVRIAECFDAEVKVTRDGTTVSGGSIMGLMMLGAGPGSTILVQATGKQAREALDAITTLVENGFDEDGEGVGAAGRRERPPPSLGPLTEGRRLNAPSFGSRRMPRCAGTLEVSWAHPGEVKRTQVEGLVAKQARAIPEYAQHWYRCSEIGGVDADELAM